MREKGDGTRPESEALHIMRNLGFFGYYLHVHWGGRNGKQHILVELLAHEGRMTQRDLQEASCITSASLSEVIAKLEAEGLRRARAIRDRPPPAHGDAHQAGDGAGARGVLRTREEFERLAFDCLSPEETTQLASTLDRVAARWMEIEAEKRGDDR